MEVGRKNFNEVLPQVRESIDKADFLVIDAEFSGLMKGRDGSIFDTPKDYYYAMLNLCTDFTLLQYGLSAFFWDEKKKQYMNETYNFHLFPRGRPAPDKMFLCQSSSLDFLLAQGFDFNKWIREGISYMTQPEENRLRESLTEKHKLMSIPKANIVIPDQNKKYVEDVCTRVKQFIDNKELNEMEIDKCNSFQRLLLFQEFHNRFKDEVVVETKILEDQTRILRVTRIKSNEDSKNRDKQKKERDWQELEDAVGFSKVARMISQSEKLVVGHNMLLDLMHTLNHFFQPLPSNYNSFKEFAHCMFPSLLDTKFMSSMPPFKDKVQSSVLSHLLATLSSPPFSLPEVGCVSGRGYSSGEGRAHEAGYDAYTTGCCLLALSTHLAPAAGDGERVGPCASAPHLRPYLNKLFLARTAQQDSPYMNFAGPDPSPPRDHVFYLTFPKDWTRNDIGHLFSPFGQVTVQFEDDTHALVALSRRDQARTVLRTLQGNKSISLITYDEYKANQHSRYEIGPEYRYQKPAVLTNSKEQVNNAPAEDNPTQKQERSPRARAQSVSLSRPSGPITRKRTSSGVIQVEDKPSPEITEQVRSKSDGMINKNSTGKRKDRNCLPSPTHGNRKRTSSGVFQADDLEPPPKKPESTPVKKKANGKRKEKESPKKEGATKKENIIERFDSEAKTVCVNAFKESDSWD